MTKWVAVVACVGLGASSVQGQPAPARSPEVSQLGWYVGKWSAAGESRGSAEEAYSEVSGEETCEWFAGGPSVLCRETTTDRNVTSTSLYILAYDAARKLYTVYGTDNTGAIYSATGTVAQGVWSWTGEARAEGQAMPMKYSFHPSPGGGRTMDVEIAAGEGAWLRILGLTYKPLN